MAFHRRTPGLNHIHATYILFKRKFLQFSFAGDCEAYFGQYQLTYSDGGRQIDWMFPTLEEEIDERFQGLNKK